jgi:hypothetical protein
MAQAAPCPAGPVTTIGFPSAEVLRYMIRHARAGRGIALAIIGLMVARVVIARAPTTESATARTRVMLTLPPSGGPSS